MLRPASRCSSRVLTRAAKAVACATFSVIALLLACVVVLACSWLEPAHQDSLFRAVVAVVDVMEVLCLVVFTALVCGLKFRKSVPQRDPLTRFEGAQRLTWQ